MDDISVTWLVFHATGQLKDLALLNICDISVTRLVSHATGRLKAIAPLNMAAISVTRLVSHATGRLKAVAPLNMPAIVVTRLVSHAEIFSLKVAFPANRELMSVILRVSHVEMSGPRQSPSHTLATHRLNVSLSGTTRR